MPPKRKAPAAPKGAAKAGRASELSTPGPATPRSLADSDRMSDSEGGEVEETDRMRELAAEAEEFVDKFNIDSDRFQQAGSRRHFDSASIHFGSQGQRDYSFLSLRPDHNNRPLWIDSRKGIIILEKFNPAAAMAQDLLIAIAEPKSRPAHLHEYQLTPHSLYAAVSVGLEPSDIIGALDRFLKTPLPESIRAFILQCTRNYGKVKLVLKGNKYYVESSDEQVLQNLLKDPVIGPLRVHTGTNAITTSNAPTMRGLVIPGTNNAAGVQQASGLQPTQDKGGEVAKTTEADVYATLNAEEDDDDEKATIHAFEIPDTAVETVQHRCLKLDLPILEEYDFRNDYANANLEIDLRPNTQIRPYQEKSLSKMFGNGRAKSGIIVLPCGAGKTLVGITAACTIKKGVVVLCTSSMSVYQWRSEFLKWSNIAEDDITVFTSESKQKFKGNTGIIVTTYSMLNVGKQRAHDTQKMIDFLGGREWGLMLLDEVHVVPAEIFRKVISTIKSHSKLGLTATLLREDDKISHLNFLVGPKLYEANWMELSQQGHIAKVQCAEVWCPMPSEFYDEYLRERDEKQAALRRTLSAMNPRKFQACQYLIEYHEKRGDKIIVFSDDLYALKAYSRKLKKYCIYGDTPNNERMHILQNFQNNPSLNTLFLSKIGDTSLDLPEATVLIQISSHFGSRRQEAQRLGRILRAKRRNDEGFNAFFYSLVSKDTQEMFYSSKRQAFLVDQGYAFKVITQLANLENTPNLAFATPEERRGLLQRIISDWIAHGHEEDVENDDLFGKSGGGGRRKKKGVRRTAGTLGGLSGGQDMAYVEQNKAAGKGGKKGKPEQSAFFKKLAREKERKKQQMREAQG
jgi:DNA excision repair protein ERCC-3